MPEPIFRSSKGRSLRNAAGEADTDKLAEETLASAEAETLGEQTDELNEASANVVRAAPVKVDKPKRGCARSFALVVGIVAVLAVATVAAVIYYLFYLGPSDSGPF